MDVRIGENAKSNKGSKLSKETAADLREKSNSRIKTSVRKNQDEELARRLLMKEKGLHLCDERDPTTKRFCRGVYLSEDGLKAHIANTERQAKKHDFPVGVNAKTHLLLTLSKPGGYLAAGSRPDRMNKGSPVDTIESTEEYECEEAKCFGAFNRKKAGKRRRKTPTQLKILEEMFFELPKLNAKRMRERMSVMLDTDGSLLFTYAKGGTTGILLSEEQINSWITRRTAKRKKADQGEDSILTEQEEIIASLLQNADDDEEDDEDGTT
jgi:hypothetical protein